MRNEEAKEVVQLLEETQEREEGKQHGPLPWSHGGDVF